MLAAHQRGHRRELQHRDAAQGRDRRLRARAIRWARSSAASRHRNGCCRLTAGAAVFEFGAIVTAVADPDRGPDRSPRPRPTAPAKEDLTGVNKTLTAFGKAPIDSLPPAVEGACQAQDHRHPVERRSCARSRCCWRSATCSTPSPSTTSSSSPCRSWPTIRRAIRRRVAATVLTWANVGGFFGSLAVRLRDGAASASRGRPR